MAKKPNPDQLNLFDDWLVVKAPVYTGPSQDNQPQEVFANPRQSLSMSLAEKLDDDGEITSRFLTEEANRIFGGTQAAGFYSSKDAYDAMEAAFNIHLSRTEIADWNDKDAQWASNKAGELTRRIQKLPTQTRRDEEMEEFQQFSTPPSLAFVANWVANIQPSDVMMDSSAGTGDLAIWSKIAGAEVILNELSQRRFDLLADLFPQAKLFRENAEQLDNILPSDAVPTVIVMNPPFSSTAGRVQGQRDTTNGARHIEQALKRLEDKGRLVAIVGNGMAADRPAFSKWWTEIKNKYNVRANVGISGKEYAKYGTTFDNQILVIDKTGPTVQPILTGKVESVTELPTLLEEIRNERHRIKRGVDKSAIHENPQSEQNSVQSNDGLSGPSPAAGGTGTQPIGNGSGRGTSIAGGETDGQPSTGDGTHDGIGTGDTIQPGLGGNLGGSSGADIGGNRGVTESDGAGAIAVESVSLKGEGFTDSVFSNYTPQRLTIPGAKQHPGKLVQSAAMSAVEPPSPKYSPILPHNLIQDGLLSIAQLESVVYAGQAHSEHLPNGSRRGFFIGDGTGVGKGREISGIILDNMMQGRNKAVWVSFNEGLIEDAKRDFAGVGGDPSRIFFQGKTKAGNEISRTDGILFTTYSTLRGGERKQANDLGQEAGKTRAQQIIDWLGKDFDGVIAFDEAHSMGNAIAIRGKRGVKKPSQQAIAGINLQRDLPQARVVYVSATGATEISNLSYADRLGLWGEGTPFPDVNAFIDNVSRGGIASMELISRDMKALGMYLSRSLSYDGVTYERLEHELTEFQEDVYNELAGAWQVVLSNVDEALEITQAGKNGNAKSAALSQFWGAHQRFFNQVITAMQTPRVIDDIRLQIESGNVAVIQLVNTNEAAQERIIAEATANDAALEDLDFTPRQMLMDYVRSGFPVAAYEESEDENGNRIYVPVYDSEGNQVFDREAIALRDALLETLQQIRVPENPLDSIINAFGPDRVAEVTGRSRRFIQTRDDEGNLKIVEEKRSKNVTRADATAFQANKKDILIFSGAGGTGYSFHADNTTANQRKRIHYILQPGWRADGAVQGFGRTHRTNQATTPHYVLPTTNLKAQKRFVSSIARRLDQLGALTRGQREATSQGMFTASDNLESEYASTALRNFFGDLYRGVTPLSFQEVTKQMGMNLLDSDNASLNESKIPGIPQFLNRLLSLKTDMQNAVFGEFESRLIEAVEYAKQHGLYDTGLQTMTALSIQKTRDDVAYEDKNTGAKTRYVELAVTNEIEYNSWEDAKEIANKRRDPSDLSGWFVSESEKTKGNVFYLADIGPRINSQGDPVHRAVVHSIKKHKHKYIDNADAVNRGYEYKQTTVAGRVSYERVTTTRRIDETEAEKIWNEQVSLAPKTETKNERMLVGVILPIWDRVEGSETIIRLQTDDGEQLLGRMLGLKASKQTLKNLGLNSSLSNMTPKELFGAIQSGNKAILANGWEIFKAKVNFEDRIEIKGRSSLTEGEKRGLKEQGAFVERIAWVERVFIPNGESGAAIFERITTSKPVVDLIGKSIHADEVNEDEQHYGVYREPEKIILKEGVHEMKNTFDIVIPGTGEKQTFTDPKEAGAAFFAVDRTLSPTVIHGMENNRGRFMAVTEIHGTYENGERRFVKTLPNSHDVDQDFRLGYMEALEHSITERLKEVDWAKSTVISGQSPNLDPKLYDDLETLSRQDESQAKKIWSAHVPAGTPDLVFTTGNNNADKKKEDLEIKPKDKRPFHEQVAERLIAQLKEGTAPWQRAWEPGRASSFLPMNPTTDKRYRGINTLNLMSRGYSDPRWLTYNQAVSINAQVRKGEKGTAIQFWQFTEERAKKDENGRPVFDAEGKAEKELFRLERPKVFYATVFNAAQIDGLPPMQIDPRKEQQWSPLERAERILEASGAIIKHLDQDRAFYRPSTDSIHLPLKEQFSSTADYYAIALHELGHWTGHSTRLDRDLANPYGSEGYAREELRAEIASMILGADLEIGHDPTRHAAYVGSWINALQDDPLEIFRAAADAEKIQEYVLAFERQQIIEQEVSMQSQQNQEEAISGDVLAAKEDSISTPIASEKTWLAVPYEQHKTVKALAGILPNGKKAVEWDKEAKCWFANPGADLEKLKPWIPKAGGTHQEPTISPREEFTEALTSLGCIVTGEHPIMDGQAHRISVQGDKIGEQAGFYVGHLDGHPAGYMKNNRTGLEMKWKSKGYVLDPEQKAEMQAEAARKLQARAAEQERLQELVAQRVARQLQSNTITPVTSPTSYMKNKGISPKAGAYTDIHGESTYIPAIDAEGKQWTMQYIQGDGTKRFAKGGRKEGCFHVVGGEAELAKAPVLVIGEGYATASSISQVLEFATVAAFDSGNLVHVAEALHQKYPDKPVVITGDDDKHLELTMGINPGRRKAEEAAIAVGGKVLLPIFAPGEQTYPASLDPVTPDKYAKGDLSEEQRAAVENMKRYTDFNDLATKSVLGQEGIARQVRSVVNDIIENQQAKIQKQQQDRVHHQEHRPRKASRIG